MCGQKMNNEISDQSSFIESEYVDEKALISEALKGRWNKTCLFEMFLCCNVIQIEHF